MRRLVTVVGLLLLAAARADAAIMFGFSPSGSQTLTVTTTTGNFDLQAFDTGWYNATGSHSPTNTNYAICDSSSCPGNSPPVNDFFAFRLGTITGDFLSATLSIGNPAGGYSGPPSSSFLTLFDFTGDVNDLLNGTGGVAANVDLGSGVAYGGRSVSAADNGSQVVINLNNAALVAISQALNANQGPGVFVVGGTLEPSAVPEPGTLALLGLSLAGLAAARRRKQ